MQATRTISTAQIKLDDAVLLADGATREVVECTEQFATYTLNAPLAMSSSAPTPAEEDKEGEKDNKEAQQEPSEGRSETKTEPTRDPLRWFGILTPPSLKEAQRSAIQLVELATQLASKEAELRSFEIEVRRARKRKANSEVARARLRLEAGKAGPR